MKMKYEHKKITSHESSGAIIVLPADIRKDWDFNGYKTDEANLTYETETKMLTIEPYKKETNGDEENSNS